MLMPPVQGPHSENYCNKWFCIQLICKTEIIIVLRCEEKGTLLLVLICKERPLHRLKKVSFQKGCYDLPSLLCPSPPVASVAAPSPSPIAEVACRREAANGHALEVNNGEKVLSWRPTISFY